MATKTLTPQQQQLMRALEPHFISMSPPAMPADDSAQLTPAPQPVSPYQAQAEGQHAQDYLDRLRSAQSTDRDNEYQE